MFCKHRIRLAAVHHENGEYGPRMNLNGYCLVCGKQKRRNYNFSITHSDSEINQICYAIDWTVSDEGISHFFDS